MVAPDATLRDRLRTIVGPLGIEVDGYATVDVVLTAPLDAIVVVDYDALDALQRVRLRAAMTTSRVQRLVVCSAGAPELADLCESSGLRHIVAPNESDEFTGVRNVVQRMLEGGAFGIDRYFADHCPRGRATLSDSSGRETVIAEVDRFATEQGVSFRLTNLFVTLTDELLTNGLYNAPVDVDGRPRFANVSRAEHIELDLGECIEVQWIGDGHRLGVSVVDPFGSLREEQVQGYLAAHLRAERRGPRRGPGGARLGLLHAFSAATQFVCMIDRNVRTEVIGMLDVNCSYRTFAAQAKSFHIFSAPTQPGPSWDPLGSTTGVDPGAADRMIRPGPTRRIS